MGLPHDLGLVGNQFGNAVTVFYATYVFFETPLSIAMKVVGAKNLLSFCMLGWGVVCLGTGFVKNAGQLYACRLLLGMFEAGLIPCINAYIGMVYLKSEMSMRSAIYYSFSAIAGAFGGLLASAVSNIHAGGLSPWSWLFIIEGIITIILVPLIFFAFPKDPRTAWFLNEEERNVMRLRHEINNHLSMDEEFSWAKCLSALKDPKTYMHAVIEFSVDISLFALTTFMPAIIKGMGYTSVHAQLLTVPVYFWAGLSYFICAYLSDRVGMRSPFIVFACLALMVGYIIMLTTDNVGARLTAVYILVVGLYTTVCLAPRPLNYLSHLTLEQTGMTIVWLNGNFAGHFKRSTAVGFVFSIGNTSGVVVGQVFKAQQAPRYLDGMKVTLGLTALALVLTVVQTFGLNHVNKKRQQRLEARPTTVMGKKSREVSDYDADFKYTL